MSAHVRELADLLIRWVHLIAGIMWIGNSMLFNWLDRNLERSTEDAADPRFEGRIWMVHSGGFYDVVKKQLPPGQLPEPLHWFKWQNFTTWASGIFLLVIVYYLGGGGLLIDPSVRAMGVGAAAGLGLGSIVVAWVVYDLIFRSPLAKVPAVAAMVGFALLGGLAAGLGHFLSARAAYIHVGVVIGTLMTGNVWFTIIPSQRELVVATKEGRAQDPAIGKRAKQRSIHNNYLTFPLLFIMISNHFPSTYGSPRAWVTLGVITFGGALVRHFMNIRFTWREGWVPATIATVIVSVGALYALTKPRDVDAS
ncbi:MAG: urate hydroxylase PuuD, partial [Polyangiales bacterium]